MSRSERQFDRWVPHDKSSWPFRVFQRYNRELEDLWHAHWVSMKSTYGFISQNGAAYEDPATSYLKADEASKTRFKTIRSWSDSMNLFDNWTNLNIVLSLASNLETFMAAAIALAVESDPGVLLGASKSVDGALVIKRRHAAYRESNLCVEACVKGEWSSRLDAFEKLFGEIPQLRSAHSTLERVRVTRNKVGHAFGRNIEQARKHGALQKLPMEKLSRTSADKIRQEIYRFAKMIDTLLLSNHIGEYEAVRFYALMYENINKNVHQRQRAAYLKHQFGGFGAVPRAKTYCNGLVHYWEAL